MHHSYKKELTLYYAKLGIFFCARSFAALILIVALLYVVTLFSDAAREFINLNLLTTIFEIGKNIGVFFLSFYVLFPSLIPSKRQGRTIIERKGLMQKAEIAKAVEEKYGKSDD